MFKFALPAVVALLLCLGCSKSISEKAPVPLAVKQNSVGRMRSEAVGKKWIVSTQGIGATEAVREIYEDGGNMIDAAVAASFAISVERPHSTGIGGGGFLLYREAKTGMIYAIDFRERAPPRAHDKLFVDGKGEVIPDKSTVGTYASGVPGLVKGMVEIHAKFGKLPFARLVHPAINLASDGFRIYPTLSRALKEEAETLSKFPTSKAIFFKKNNVYKEGDWIEQKDLAKTLRRIAETGGKDFYTGETARAIARASKGWITEKDLKDYRVIWRDPVRGTFRGHEIVSMPPPSSGGTHVIEILNILENKKLSRIEPRSPEAVHYIAAAMQSAFVDRARYMGDPGFVKVPVAELTSKAYAKKIYAAIDEDEALKADARALKIPAAESTETTHFSIMDEEGNMVASTQSINGWFGNYQVVPGTGILMNNTMDDFAAKPGALNIFGAVGSTANLPAGGKTPLSSMSPTLVLKDGAPVMAVGAPGGTRIITCVANTLLNYLEFKRTLYESVAMVRVHHQWRPDELVVEDPGIGAEAENDLGEMGYSVKRGTVGCAVMAVAREGALLRGVSDPRDVGMALGQ